MATFRFFVSFREISNYQSNRTAQDFIHGYKSDRMVNARSVYSTVRVGTEKLEPVLN